MSFNSSVVFFSGFDFTYPRVLRGLNIVKGFCLKVQCAHTEMVDIDLLVMNPLNPNKHGEKQIELLAKIMDHQGWRHPITVSKRSGFVVSGHGRLMAAKKNGWTHVPVDRQDFANEADEYAHLIADNKIAELAEHDDQMMTEGLKSFPDMDLDLLGMIDFKMPEQLEPFEGAVELDPNSFDNFDHQCPKCGFEWDDAGTT